MTETFKHHGLWSMVHGLYLLSMYSKQESSKLRHEFWTVFGKYMNPLLSAEGEKINWINYKTGKKDIFFRMHADNKKASISVELTHKDPQIQELIFHQLLQFKTMMEQTLGEEWTWQLHTNDEHGRMVSRIYKEILGPGIFRKQDWPSLISFFKPRIIALDEFWTGVKDVVQEGP